MVAALALGACGADERRAPAPPGSPQNPLEATHPGEGEAAAVKPNFDALVDGQRQAPAEGGETTNPCGLVTKAQAQRILGAGLLDPYLAPQGPTCVFRDRDGQHFVTLAIQDGGLDALREHLQRPEAVQVAGQRGYCGMQGAPTLFVGLGGGDVLNVKAQCDTAVQFARRALPEAR